jgi:hypothetical protein
MYLTPWINLLFSSSLLNNQFIFILNAHSCSWTCTSYISLKKPLSKALLKKIFYMWPVNSSTFSRSPKCLVTCTTWLRGSSPFWNNSDKLLQSGRKSIRECRAKTKSSVFLQLFILQCCCQEQHFRNFYQAALFKCTLPLITHSTSNRLCGIKARKYPVRFPMKSLEFSLDVILTSSIMTLGSTQPITEMS